MQAASDLASEIDEDSFSASGFKNMAILAANDAQTTYDDAFANADNLAILQGHLATVQGLATDTATAAGSAAASSTSATQKQGQFNGLISDIASTVTGIEDALSDAQASLLVAEGFTETPEQNASLLEAQDAADDAQIALTLA